MKIFLQNMNFRMNFAECWVSHQDDQWVTALPTHPYLLFITSDWTVALETVIMSQVTSL